MDPQDPAVSLDYQAVWDNQDHQDLPEPPATKDHAESRVYQAAEVFRVYQDPQAHPAALEAPDPEEMQDLPDHLDPQDQADRGLSHCQIHQW